jgi:hypothetical protein
MKHLKKKFVLHFQFNEKQQKEMNQIPDAREEFRQLPDSEKEEMNAFLFTEEGEIFQAFRYRANGKTIMIPEPNPVVIYFDSARNYSQQLKKYREKVFENARSFEENFVGVNGDFYWYFSMASSYAIFLFAALEAFVNKSIPPDFEYRREIQDKRAELFNRAQVQREIQFLEKVKSVLPQVKGKNFVSEFTHKFEYIKKLKEFRDEVAHTKSYDGGPTANSYENLYVMSLEFEYEKTLLFMRDYINYYEPGLIEECNCGRED